jgi:DNA-binding protein HU-beta
MALLLKAGLVGMVQCVHRLPMPVPLQQAHPVRSISSTMAPRAAAGAAGDGAKPKVVGKAILAKRLQETHTGLTVKQANEIVDTLLDDIMLTVAEGETVTIPGFGSFKKRSRKARKGRNPSTGAELDIPAKDYPAFTPGSAFKGVVQTGSWEAYDELQQKEKAAKAAKK